jgi:hypothetical protein
MHILVAWCGWDNFHILLFTGGNHNTSDKLHVIYKELLIIFQKLIYISRYIFPLHHYIPSPSLGQFHYAIFKKICGRSSSHLCTQSLTSSSALNTFPPRASLISPNRWKSRQDYRRGVRGKKTDFFRKNCSPH